MAIIVIAFHKCLLQAENSMTGRAYAHGKSADTIKFPLRNE